MKKHGDISEWTKWALDHLEKHPEEAKRNKWYTKYKETWAYAMYRNRYKKDGSVLLRLQARLRKGDHAK